MSKAKNWIIGIGAIYILAQVFGTEETKSPPKPETPSATQKASSSGDTTAQPLGFMQSSASSITKQPAPTIEKHPYVDSWVFTTSRVNMRAEPSTSSRVILTIDAGQSFKVLNHRTGWFSITYKNRTGWVYGQYLSENPPAKPQPPTKTIKTPAPPVAHRVAPSRNTGQAVRAPYVGRCDCPYDLMRNGHRCGGRSAYSRPGGRNPVCYY